jgi:hypothetical protein
MGFLRTSGVLQYGLILVLTVFATTGCSSGSTPASATPTSTTNQAALLESLPPGDVISGTSKINGQASADRSKSTACPKLDSRLSELLSSDDPLKTAGQLGLSLLDQKIQVVIVLKGEDTAFLEEYEVDPGTLSGSELQVYASLSRLCDLSNRDEILAIRLPAAAVAP